MTAEPIFRGAATALVTPMTATEEVDYEAFGRLIDWQIEQGIDALVIAGTSGEGSTLTDTEHREVLRYAVDRVAGRVPVIARREGNMQSHSPSLAPSQTIEKRLKQLEKLYKKRLVTEEEYNSTRARILSEL